MNLDKTYFQALSLYWYVMANDINHYEDKDIFKAMDELGIDKKRKVMKVFEDEIDSGMPFI